MTASNPFHLAIPVSDLDAWRFMRSTGSAGVRVTIAWISTSLVINWCFTEQMREKGAGQGSQFVDGELPVPHLAWCSNGRLLRP